MQWLIDVLRKLCFRQFTMNIYNAKRNHGTALPRTTKVRQPAFPRKQKQTYNRTCNHSTCHPSSASAVSPTYNRILFSLQKIIILGVATLENWQRQPLSLDLYLWHTFINSIGYRWNQTENAERAICNCSIFAKRKNCNLARRHITSAQWIHNAR